ncbi:MAG: imidazole glycerol phosphate synthase subunit HisH [Dehalococcoidia bacterium]|nr:imidazole glycerol phosphate synthase subunit HisH [Dehalococcoidia bacterium]MCD5400706.1 imidazole glycerol phosphate synthase subunit HisH [Dehalococcoidia bacterium]
MSEPRIAIVDYQAGNVRSVQKAFQKVGGHASITSDPDEVIRADALVVPGQGASDSSMIHMREKGLVEPIKEFIASGKPFFGVCLGLQLLMKNSEEGDEPCLGVLQGRTRRLPPGQKIPHMGWNQVDFHIRHPVFDTIPDGSHFYFVHSYYADPDDKSVVACTTDYGVDFCSGAVRENVVAVQFHPEKSGALGLKIYKNFIEDIKS